VHEDPFGRPIPAACSEQEGGPAAGVLFLLLGRYFMIFGLPGSMPPQSVLMNVASAVVSMVWLLLTECMV
jgi:hypothetical protein